MADSLWGDAFVIKDTPKQTKKIVNKINKPKSPKVVTEKAIKSRNVSLEDKLKIIYSEVYRILGHYKDNTICIRDKETLKHYFDVAIENNEIAIDTETNNSLQPVTCKLMGPCIYTPGMKNAYIPMHHTNLAGKLLPNQLTEADFKEQLDRLKDTHIIVHNGNFDYRVVKCTCGYSMKLYWDTIIAARILNENEHANLKEQYIMHIDSTQEKYSIEHLFEDVEYQYVDPEVFALYAATDSFMTYKLFKWQEEQFKKPGHERLYSLFRDIEMAVIVPTAEMSLNGVRIDTDMGQRLSAKYHRLQEDCDKRIAEELAKYDNIIAEWRTTPEANEHPQSKKPNKNGEYTLQRSKSEQLKTPVELTSPTQFAILLYDVLKTPVVDKKKPRGTGEEIISQIDLPLCKLVVEKRGIEKLLSTYIDKMPLECCPDGKVHASFNQLGADTGRFSSDSPNIQNIPSKGEAKSIRCMFMADPGNVLIGADFSAQEPKLLATYAQDKAMIDAYNNGKDLYAVIATKMYHNKYEDNKEFDVNGELNPEGKKRRSNAKSVLLGLMYGRGANSIAEQIGSSYEEAQDIINSFYKEFHQVKDWIDETESSAHELGYVEDLWGRRRRLPDIQLPKYTVKYKGEQSSFNPILGSLGLVDNAATKLIQKYNDKLTTIRGRKAYSALQAEALTENVVITDNGGFISRAERQCVNARIQGGAASMSKRAMIGLYNDPVMDELGFRLCIMVHDELIGQCPIENVEQCKERLAYWMQEAGKPECSLPMKTDVAEFDHWYLDECESSIQEDYSKLIKNHTHEEAVNIISTQHCEFLPETILSFINN